MNPIAAKELLDLIMIDDYVARKQALNDWSRRWVATLQIKHPVPLEKVKQLTNMFPGQSWERIVAYALTEKMVIKLAANEVEALWVGYEDSGDTRLSKLEMHVVLQKPRGT